MLHAAPALAPAPGPWVLGQLETQSLFSLEVTLQTDLSHHYNCQFITISINLGATWEKWPAPQPPRGPPLGWLHRQWCQQHRAVACEDPGGACHDALLGSDLCIQLVSFTELSDELLFTACCQAWEQFSRPADSCLQLDSGAALKFESREVREGGAV